MKIPYISGAIVALLIFVSFSVGMGMFLYLNRPVDIHHEPVYFTIHPNESLRSISRRLEDEGHIRSALLMEFWGRMQKTNFRKGQYILPANIKTVALHDHLLYDSEVMEHLTIPEGYTLRKIAARVENAGVTSAELFLNYARTGDALEKYGIIATSTEGFLYPDTYFFPQNYPAEMVVQHMVATFFIKLKAIYPDYLSIDPQLLYEKIVLASIVEREYVVEHEAEIIASVFYNRLDAEMMLQSCATVVYVMTEEEKMMHPERLLYSDLRRESKFNTYLHTGLPPAPISNPGSVALNAAFFPAETDYWFFVLKGADASKHYFSRSYEEHNQAAFLYLKSSS